MAFKWRFRAGKGSASPGPGDALVESYARRFGSAAQSILRPSEPRGQIETPRLEQLPRPNESTNGIKAGAAITRRHYDHQPA
jgi:hypothetical protein